MAQPMNQVSAMSKAPLILCVALAGCVGGLEPEPELDLDLDSASTSPSPAVEPIFYADEQEQGRHILGSFPDTLLANGVHFRVSVIPQNEAGVRLSVNAAGVKGVNGTHLVADDPLTPGVDHTGADPWFDELIMSGAGGELRIRRSEKTGTSIISTLYFLDYRTVTPGNTGPWVDYCGTSGGGAIPISGYYDFRRTHESGAWISFACADSAAQKCNHWGFAAGNAGPTDKNWQHHQACTGMTNANYCGTGQSFTREKTPILIRDAVLGYGNDQPNNFGHPAVMPGHPDVHYIEAGWLPNGRPLCLSKLRWHALSPNQCGAALPDPRYQSSAEAKFCDQWTIPQLFAAGAILVNGSKMMDAPLHRWRNSLGDDLTTIRGYFIDRNGDGIADPESTLPLNDYFMHVGVEGMLLRNLPGTLSETQMRPLYLQNMTGGDRHLSDVGGGRADPAFEGYTFKNLTTLTTNGATIVGTALQLCKVGSDHDTMLGACGATATVRGLGYALPAP